MLNRLVKKVSLLLVLSLLYSLVEVHSQTFPYVSFMGQTLASHSYVDLSLVGTSDNNSLQCITNLMTCCSRTQGLHRGDWYFPNGSMLQFSGDIFESREPQRVSLRRDRNPVIVGVYRCDVSTNRVHDSTDSSVRDVVYVGLYTPDQGKLTSPLPSYNTNFIVLGTISLLGSMTLDLGLQTLTCISTGGPATTVTWTRDSVLLTEGNETVLNDPVTAQYTHTLAVAIAGVYTCTVANNKPSSASASITLEGL